jgi:hypothetical protein
MSPPAVLESACLLETMDYPETSVIEIVHCWLGPMVRLGLFWDLCRRESSEVNAASCRLSSVKMRKRGVDPRS